MDNFDKIIREKVEQFEVPYNDAHWAEMDGKLNSIRTAKIRKNVFTALGAIALLGLSTYLIIFNNDTTNDKNNNNIVVDNTVASDNESNIAKIVNEAPSTTTINNTLNNTEENSSIIDEENHNEENSEKTIEVQNTEKDVLTNPKELKTEVGLTPDFIVYNNTICLGETVSFESLEKNSPVSYTWNFGDGATSNKANPKHTYEKDGVYSVTLVIKNRQSGIEEKSIQEKVVTILPTPNVDFIYTELSVKNDNNKLKYPYTNFEIKGADSDYSYQWILGNGKTSNNKMAKTIYEKEGNYKTSLLVKSNNGCSTKISKNVIIKNGIDLYAPKAFKPNSNISENETFIPMALLGWDVQFDMTIKDNSGKTLYKSSDKNEPWNGTLNNNGQIIPAGIYFWEVLVYDYEGVKHIHRGSVQLLR